MDSYYAKNEPPQLAITHLLSLIMHVFFYQTKYNTQKEFNTR
jgi:hypothetical protein